jgi:hypothetical protein
MGAFASINWLAMAEKTLAERYSDGEVPIPARLGVPRDLVRVVTIAIAVLAGAPSE